MDEPLRDLLEQGELGKGKLSAEAVRSLPALENVPTVHPSVAVAEMDLTSFDELLSPNEGDAMSAARDIKKDLIEFLRELELTEIRRCFEDRARQADLESPVTKGTGTGTGTGGARMPGTARPPGHAIGPDQRNRIVAPAHVWPRQFPREDYGSAGNHGFDHGCQKRIMARRKDHDVIGAYDRPPREIVHPAMDMNVTDDVEPFRQRRISLSLIPQSGPTRFRRRSGGNVFPGLPWPTPQIRNRAPSCTCCRPYRDREKSDCLHYGGLPGWDRFRAESPQARIRSARRRLEREHRIWLANFSDSMKTLHRGGALQHRAFEQGSITAFRNRCFRKTSNDIVPTGE